MSCCVFVRVSFLSEINLHEKSIYDFLKNICIFTPESSSLFIMLVFSHIYVTVAFIFMAVKCILRKLFTLQPADKTLGHCCV